MSDRTGRCLCGAVRFAAEVASEIAACHCAMCRRWAGGPFLAARATLSGLEGEEHVARYPSSPWAERAFCAVCGSSLFYRVTAPGPHQGDTHVSVGALDDAAGMTLRREIFIDDKPAAYAFAGETEKMTGAEVFAMFAPKAEG